MVRRFDLVRTDFSWASLNMPKPERLDDDMLFDFEAFWGSDHVKIMTGDQVAVYVRLLSTQWREGDLPADPRLLALRASHGERHVTTRDLVGKGTLGSPDAGSIWEALRPCYRTGPDGKFVWNERGRVDREAWLKKKAGWKAGGEASAKARLKRLESSLEAPSEATSEAPSEGSRPSLSSSYSEGEEKERSAADAAARRLAPSLGLPAWLACFGSLLTGSEKLQLTGIMAAEPVDPASVVARSKKETDETAMRRERLYLLASLERRTRGSVGDGSTAFELFATWRKAARSKSRKVGSSNWISDVKGLRELLLGRSGIRGPGLLKALSTLAEKGWRSLEWHMLEKKRGEEPSGAQSGAEGVYDGVRRMKAAAEKKRQGELGEESRRKAVKR